MITLVVVQIQRVFTAPHPTCSNQSCSVWDPMQGFLVYPVDAPPIEDCVHKQGLLVVVLWYGYGEWNHHSVDVNVKLDVDVQFGFCHDNEDDNDCWDGGDLFLDYDEGKDKGKYSNVVLLSQERSNSSTDKCYT